MLASEFIDFYLRQASASVDRTFVLSTANWVQNKIAGMDTEFLRILPDPYFTTTAATYSYIANVVCLSSVTATPGGSVGDVRMVREVYRRDPVPGAGDDFGRQPYPDRIARDSAGGRFLAPIQCQGSGSPLADDCAVLWDLGQDPGDNTTLWRARAYRWPTQLSAEGIALTIPDDFAFDLLFEGVAAIIERAQYGKADYPLGMENQHMKRFMTKYSSPTDYTRIRSAPPLNA